MVQAMMEALMTRTTRDGRRTFFDTARFPWVQDVEANWRAIRRELDVLLQERDQIPNFQDVSPDQAILTEGEQWKTFFFFAYGKKAEENCARCPETVKTLKLIPGMKTAMFSILAPGKHIPGHRGPYKGVLRYHLGLKIPQPSSQCRILVGEDVRSWEEGKSLIFDDSHWHEAWNDAQEYRVVLFVDFLRPLWFPLSLANRIQVWRIARRPFITDAMALIRAASGRKRAAAGGQK